jgi:hypothetical protein
MVEEGFVKVVWELSTGRFLQHWENVLPNVWISFDSIGIILIASKLVLHVTRCGIGIALSHNHHC